MPKLWDQTIQAHRHQVRDAILDTTAALVNKRGLLAVTMSQIAEVTGIGRATLYKYFSDVEAILVAFHHRQITAHLQQLAGVRDQPGTAGQRLKAVLDAYALMVHTTRGQHNAKLGALLHGEHEQPHVAEAEQQLKSMVRDLLTEAAAAGEVRDDTPPDELANYCLHALAGAGRLPSAAAVGRLVALTLAGVRSSSSGRPTSGA